MKNSSEQDQHHTDIFSSYDNTGQHKNKCKITVLRQTTSSTNKSGPKTIPIASEILILNQCSHLTINELVSPINDRRDATADRFAPR